MDLCALFSGPRRHSLAERSLDDILKGRGKLPLWVRRNYPFSPLAHGWLSLLTGLQSGIRYRMESLPCKAIFLGIVSVPRLQSLLSLPKLSPTTQTRQGPLKAQ